MAPLSTPRSSIGRVLAWCAARGIQVEDGPGNCYYVGLRLIELSKRDSPQTRLFTLLHECGHVLCDKTRPKRWPRGYQAIGTPLHRKSLGHSIECLAEEVEAWHRGERLAKRLGVRLDLDAFRKCRNAALASYARLC